MPRSTDWSQRRDVSVPTPRILWIRLKRLGHLVRVYEAIRRRVVLWRWKRWVRELVGPVGSVLEIGPGIYPQTWLTGSYYLAIEAHDEYADVLRAKGVPVLTRTAQAWAARDAGYTTDAVIMSDVLEHLTKEDGDAVIRAAQDRARVIVVMTPLGYLAQDGGGETDAWGMQGQAWQRHRSGWTPADLPGWAVQVDPYFHGREAGAFVAVWRRDGLSGT